MSTIPPPAPPLPWLGLPPRTPWVLTASPVAGRSSPAAQHRAVSLPAARPCSEDACGCACIACAGILGGKSAKNTSEAPLPGQRGFVQIKAEQRLPGRDVGQGRWAGRCQGLTLPSVVLLPVFPSSRASPAKHADALPNMQMPCVCLCLHSCTWKWLHGSLSLTPQAEWIFFLLLVNLQFLLSGH